MKLSDRLPPFLTELTELECLTGTEQPEFEQARKDVQKLHDEFSLFTLNDYGCSRWEAVMGIRARAAAPPEERRKKILQIYLSHLPYTYRVLMQYLEEAAPGYEAALDYANYRLRFRARAEEQQNHRELYGTLRRMIPANIAMDYRYYSRGKPFSVRIGSYTRSVQRVTVRAYQPGNLESALRLASVGSVKSGTRITILSQEG